MWAYTAGCLSSKRDCDCLIYCAWGANSEWEWGRERGREWEWERVRVREGERERERERNMKITSPCIVVLIWRWNSKKYQNTLFAFCHVLCFTAALKWWSNLTTFRSIVPALVRLIQFCTFHSIFKPWRCSILTQCATSPTMILLAMGRCGCLAGMTLKVSISWTAPSCFSKKHD